MINVLTLELPMGSGIRMLSLIGLFLLALVQMPDHGVNGEDNDNKTKELRMDLFERGRGVSMGCLVEVVEDYERNNPGQSGDNVTVICDASETIKTCIDTSINKMTKDESEALIRELLLQSQEVLIDSICEDGGRKFEDIVFDEEAKECMGRRPDKEEMKDCIKKEVGESIEEIQTLNDVEKCKAMFKISRCSLEVFSDCKTKEVYDFFHGVYEAWKNVSSCEHNLASAVSLSIHLLPLLAVLYVNVF